jgi:MFS family permease
VQGVGAAVMFAVSLALLAHAFPGHRERAGALAAYGASIGGAFAIGPLVGGLLTSGLSWEWIFAINVPIGIACLWITRTYVVESRDPAARRIDWPGQISLAAGLFLLVFALIRGNEYGWGSTEIVLELAGALAALVAFVVIEARVAEPMLPLSMFRNRAFTGAQIAAFAISASFFAVFLYSTLYLQSILGLSAIEAGLAYLPGTIVMLFVSGATSVVFAKVPGARHGRRRARARRGRHGPVHHGRGRLVVDDHPARRVRRPHRHGPVQPRPDRGGARLGSRRAERAWPPA